MNEERTPDGIYGHWVKKMIEEGAELEDDIDDGRNRVTEIYSERQRIVQESGILKRAVTLRRIGEK